LVRLSNPTHTGIKLSRDHLHAGQHIDRDTLITDAFSIRLGCIMWMHSDWGNVPKVGVLCGFGMLSNANNSSEQAAADLRMTTCIYACSMLFWTLLACL
jgi:hypothetical protein